MSSIEAVFAREILDSRGNPTVEVEVLLADGTEASAAVLEAEHHVNETVKNLISDVELAAEPPVEKKVKR